MKKPVRIAFMITMFVIAASCMTGAVYLGTHGNVLASLPLILISGGFGLFAGHDLMALNNGK